jgi:uncharacterized protein (DUF1778 family)
MAEHPRTSLVQAAKAARATRSAVTLRADEQRRGLIDRAAKAVDQNRSDFILDVATREATTVLLDRCLFRLNMPAFTRFAAALDAPPSDSPRLRRLLAKKAAWER